MPTPTPILIVRTEDLDTKTRASIIRVCVTAHQEQDFNNLFSYIPSGGRHFLVYRDGVLASHAVVTTRWLQPENHPVLRTAYVDAVATFPAQQGRGLGTAVMRHMAKNIADYSIASLQTDRPAFYKRLGWELWRGPLAGRCQEGLIPTPDQRGVMVLWLPLTPDLDLDQRLTIECQSGRIW